MRKFNSNKSDLHIHTVASDGDLFPLQIIELAVELGMKHISITDHDSIKSYKDTNNNYFEIAEKNGISLIPGIELDSMYKGNEIHILGYNIDINNNGLNEYLNKVADQRKNRIFEQIDAINNKIGKEIITREDIIKEHRDIYMKPHLILTLMETKEFKDFKYKNINKWLSENIKTKTNVYKPDSKEIVKMIKESGGSAFLAHPGYYIYYNKLDIDELINELKVFGLEGVEADYPYAGTGSEIDTEKEKELLEIINMKAEEHNLLLSRGSDAHEEKRFKDFNKNKY